MNKKITIFSEKEVKNFFNKKWGSKTKLKRTSFYLTKSVDLSSGSLLPKFMALANKGDKILDLGCGDGRVSLTLLNNDYSDICAVDYSEEAINRLKNLAQMKSKKVATRVEDLNKIILGEKKYLAVICTSVLHYFSDSQILRLFRKMDLCLRSGGIIYLTFESELKLRTSNGNKFKFKNQPERRVLDYKQLLEKSFLRGRYEKKFSKTYKKTIFPTLPLFIADKLNSKDRRYVRKMVLYETILKKL